MAQSHRHWSLIKSVDCSSTRCISYYDEFCWENGSSLETAFEGIYGKVTVSNFLSSKAIAKSLRAHFLVESSLMTLLLKQFFPDNTDRSQIEPSESGTIGEDDQLPSDDEDEIEEETGDEMNENPEDPTA